MLLLGKGIFALIQAWKAEYEPDKILKCVPPKERENRRQVRKKRALFFFVLPKKEIRKLRILEKGKKYCDNYIWKEKQITKHTWLPFSQALFSAWYITYISLCVRGITRKLSESHFPVSVGKMASTAEVCEYSIDQEPFSSAQTVNITQSFFPCLLLQWFQTHHTVTLFLIVYVSMQEHAL